MTRIIGRLTKLGIGRETTRGTAVAPTYWVPVLDLSFDDKLELKNNESGYGNIAAINDASIVKKWGEGEYSGKIFHKSVGLEMVALFGQLPTSVQRTTTGVYDNTYALLNTNQHASLTVALSEANYSGRFALGVISSWSLDAALGDYIRRKISIISKASASSSETPAFTNEAEFIPKHMSIKLAAAAASDATLDSATAIKLRSISFDFNKNAEGLQVFGSNDLDDVVNKQVEITGSFEMFYDDRTYHTLAQAGTHQAMRIDMINSDVIIGTSGTHNPALRFQFTEVVIELPVQGFDNNNITTLNIPFRAVLNVASGVIATCRVTNEINGASAY